MRVPFKVLRCSSESRKLPATNLESGDKYRPWATDGPQTSATLELGLSHDSAIHSIELGNYGAAFVQIFVSSEGFAEGQLHALLPMTTLMSMMEVKAGTNADREKVFSHQLARIKDQKWRYVKVEVSQPFQPPTALGLAYLSITDALPDTASSTAAEAPTRTSVGELMTLPTLPLSVPTLSDEDEECDERPAKRPALGRDIKALQEQAHQQHQRKAAEAAKPPPPPSPVKPPAPPVARSLPGSLQGAAPSPKAPTVGGAGVAKAKALKPKGPPKAAAPPPPPAHNGKPLKRALTEVGNKFTGKAAAAEATSAPLKGCCIVLSGFVHPLRGHLQHKATALGATYHGDWEEGASTHLIAAFESTPKAKAVRKGFIVRKDWLEECFDKKRRLPEKDYRFGAPAKGGGGGVDDDDDDDDDDDSTSGTSLVDSDYEADDKPPPSKKKKKATSTTHVGAKGPTAGHPKAAASSVPKPPAPVLPKPPATHPPPAPPTPAPASSSAAPATHYEDWVLKDVRRLVDFARRQPSTDPFPFIKEIFKKCERFLKEYDDMFDVQQKLWETWEYQTVLGLPVAVRMLCKLKTTGLADAEGRRLVTDALRSYKQQYLNALLDVLEDPKPPAPLTAPTLPLYSQPTLPLVLESDPEPAPAQRIAGAVSSGAEPGPGGDGDSEATEVMDPEDVAAGVKAVEAAFMGPLTPLPSFLTPVVAAVHQCPGDTSDLRRLERMLVTYGADVREPSEAWAGTTHVVVCGTDLTGLRRRRGTKFVTAAWVETCHTEQRLVPEDPFLVDFHL